MFQDDQIFSVFMFAVSAYLFYMWWDDLRYYKKNGGKIRRGAFAGATSVPFKYCLWGAVAALLLLALHVSTEYSLGVVSEQTSFSYWAIFSWIAAAFVEELIFRGYLVVQNRGVVALALSILFFSLLFALAHPFVWNYEIPEGAWLFDGVWIFDFSAQPILSTIAIFECSLLFYILRFMPQNPNRSIMPCIMAHAAYNTGVYLVKLAQGFIA